MFNFGVVNQRLASNLCFLNHPYTFFIAPSPPKIKTSTFTDRQSLIILKILKMRKVYSLVLRAMWGKSP